MNRDKSYILDILDSAQRVYEYITSNSYERYYSDPMLQDAIVRRLTIIGEAVNRLSVEFKQENPNIPWTIIKGFRNILVHEYDSLDYDLIWQTVNNDIPKLIKQLKDINF